MNDPYISTTILAYAVPVIQIVVPTAAKKLSGFLSWLPPSTGISLLGALASWAAMFILYRSKQSRVAVSILVDRCAIKNPSIGYMPPTDEEMWSLAVKIRNVGERAAENITLHMTQNFNENEQAFSKRISGNLLINEETSVLSILKPQDAKNEKNYIKLSFNYEDKFLLRRRRYQRESTWCFNARNGHLISNDLHRVEVE